MSESYVEMELREIQTSDDPRDHPIVVLEEKNGDRRFPIFIGPMEARALDESVVGHGKGYEYAHDAEGGVAAQDYLGVEREYYRPVPRGFEAELGERLKAIRQRLREAEQS